MEELQKEAQRMDIIKSKIFYSWDELSQMPHADAMKAMIQMKQDETMKWQRLCSQLIYYVTVVSLILGAIVGFVFLTANK